MFRENKLECTEELGDLIHTHNPELALRIYLRGFVPVKAIRSFSLLRQFDEIINWSKEFNYQPSYLSEMIHVLRTYPEMANHFAQMFNDNSSIPTVDIAKVYFFTYRSHATVML